MAENTKYQPNLEDIRDLLSPYLDGEVSDEERALVEQAMADSPELEQELASLRQTVDLVAALPPMPAPRPFTLTEADVQAVAPAPKKRFWLPAWASGLAMAAATLICVVVAGGLLFFGSQFGSRSKPAAEVAVRQESAAPQAAESEEMAPAEAAAEVAVEEEAAEEEVFAEEESEEAATDAVAADVAVEEKAVTVETEAEKRPVDKESDDTAGLAEPAEVTEGEAANGAVERGVDQDAAGAAVPPTPSPQPTPTFAPPTPTTTPMPQATAPALGVGGEGAPTDTEEAMADESGLAPAEEPAPESVEEEAMAEAQAPPMAQTAPTLAGAAPTEELAESEAAQQEAAATAGEAPGVSQPTLSLEDLFQNEQALTLRREAAQPVEIQDLQLRIRPGLIQIEGIIEVEAGTNLVASLLRNQGLFNQWADPASLQSTVQTDGTFSFGIRAQADRTDQDLFAQEAADYQIIILSTGTDRPIVTTVFFDTFESTAAPAQASATATPPPTAISTLTPTVAPTPTAPIIQATAVPTVPPDSAVQATAVLQSESRSPEISLWVLGGLGLFILAVLIIMGLIIWSTINKKR